MDKAIKERLDELIRKMWYASNLPEGIATGNILLDEIKRLREHKFVVDDKYERLIQLYRIETREERSRYFME